MAGMKGKPVSERPVWVWLLMGFLLPMGVGGAALLYQWFQWRTAAPVRIVKPQEQQTQPEPATRRLFAEEIGKYDTEIESIKQKMSSLSKDDPDMYALKAKLFAAEKTRGIYLAGEQGANSSAFAQLDQEHKDFLIRQLSIKNQIKRLQIKKAELLIRPEGAEQALVPDSSYQRLNTTVSDNLNAADNLFKNGMDGCVNVSVAIMAANNEPTPESQKTELRSYAQRCGLRF